MQPKIPGSGSRAASAADPDLNGIATRARAVALHGAFAGAIGAAAIALWFLAVDLVVREALWTPSLVASRLLGGNPGGAIDLRLVAAYTLLHAALFIGFATALAAVVTGRERPLRFPAVAGGGFLALECGALLGSASFAPGLAAEIGHGWLAAGNAVAALGMAAYFASYAEAPPRS